MSKTSETMNSSGSKLMQEPVVFFGSGPVAAASLTVLAAEFNIEAVITKQTPAHHHGAAPVKELAKNLGLTLRFANTRAELDSLIVDQQFKSRLGIIVDFGVIVSRLTIDAFEFGILNSHFSLLPRWRGADPISFAILAGDKKTGVSLMLIEPTLDTGKILVQKSLKIEPEDTTPSLTDKLIILSSQLLAEYIPLYLAGKVKPRMQPHPDRVTHSRKLTKADGIIDWHKPADQIEREIRAFKEWPKSRAKLGHTEVIITSAHSVPSTDTSGRIEIIKDLGILIIYCNEGYICIERLKPIGKREMAAADFIKGYGSRIGQKAT